MYVSIYTERELRRIKDRMLWLGLFMMSGGAAALLYNLLQFEAARFLWATAALCVLMGGLVCIALSTGLIPLSKAYFSVQHDSVSFRLTFYSAKQSIQWSSVSDLQISDRYVLFNLHGGRQKMVRLSVIPSQNTASYVATSLQATALERNITVNGVRFSKQPFS